MAVYERVFSILVGNEDRFKEVAQNLHNKSKKLGLNFAYKIDTEEIREDSNGRQYLNATIKYELPDMGAYRLVAVLEIFEGKNLIKVLDDTYSDRIEDNIRNITPYCHHCKLNRKRRFLYLVWDTKNRRMMQLGKSCSKTYIGTGNVDRLYKYAYDLGNIKNTEFNTNVTQKYTYLNTELVSKIALSKLNPYYKENKFVTGAHIINVEILKMYTKYKNKELTKEELDLIRSRDISKMHNDILQNIESKGGNINRSEFNAKTLIEATHIRSDEFYHLYKYFIKYVSDNARGFNKEDDYNLIGLINTAFNYLTQDTVEFEYSGEDSSFKEVIKLYKTDEVRFSLRDIRRKWLDTVHDNRDREDEKIILYILENDPEYRVPAVSVKLVVNNIGFYLKNNYNLKGNYIGKKGERGNFNVIITNIREFERDAYMGGVETVYEYCLKHEDGELLWYTLKDPNEIEHLTKKSIEDLKYKTFTISGKIKDHRVYNGVKKTIVNYVKVVG